MSAGASPPRQARLTRLVAHFFPNSEREAAPPPTRVRPERRRAVLGAGGGRVPRSAGAGRAGGGKVVQTPAGFAAVRAGAAERRVGGRRVVGRTVPPVRATARPSPGLARVQASGHRSVPGNSCGAISIVALGGTPKQRGSLLRPALGGGRRLPLGTPPRMCSFSSQVLMPRTSLRNCVYALLQSCSLRTLGFKSADAFWTPVRIKYWPRGTTRKLLEA